MQNKKNILVLLLLMMAGYALGQDVTRRYGCRHIPVNSQGHILRAASIVPKNIYQGEKRQLVFLVDFNDRRFQDENPIMFWDRVFNQAYLQESPFVGSVHDYFCAQSYGLFRLSFDLHYVSLDKSYTLYGGSSDSNVGLLLLQILNALKGEAGDWSVYDWDDDGYVDQVIILFAGKGQNAGGGANSIWPHQWSLREQGRDPYVIDNKYCRVKIDKYCCIQELDANGGYGVFGTICHEYSHCFGLPDLYYGTSSKVVDTWDLMDHGNYNGGGFRPCGYSAHERMLMGWLTPHELTSGTTVTHMEALDNEPQAYLIRNDGYANEYYILENRQQTGWDAALPGSGFVIFHIDYDEKVWLDDYPNSDDYQRYSIIPANNLFSIIYLSGWSYPYGENNSLTNNSRPFASLYHLNTTSGSYYMSKSITNISVENGLASFDFMGGGPVSVSPLRSDHHPQILYDLGPIYIIRNAKGEVRKVMKP